MTAERAVRYRRLAMAERDPANAMLLQKLADEAERGVLHAPEPRPGIAAPSFPKPVEQQE